MQKGEWVTILNAFGADDAHALGLRLTTDEGHTHEIYFTAECARAIAAELIRLADALDPEAS